MVSPIGFGAFKIGRNQATKYPQTFDLPDTEAADALLNAVLDLGVNYIDTAPAYGLSEERIGRALSQRRSQFVLSTKVGESFIDGRSEYRFDDRSVRESIEQSLRRLRTDVLDVVFIHSQGDDMAIMQETDVVATLQSLRDSGSIRAIGLSGKTLEGARAALAWADVLMIELHPNDASHEGVIREAASRDVGVVIKKGLGSGKIEPQQAIEYVLSTPGVNSMVIGTLSLDHLRANLDIAGRCEQPANTDL